MPVHAHIPDTTHAQLTLHQDDEQSNRKLTRVVQFSEPESLFQSDEDEFAKLHEETKAAAGAGAKPAAAVPGVAAGGAGGAPGASGRAEHSDSVDSDEFQEFESYQAPRGGGGDVASGAGDAKNNDGRK